MPRGQNDVFRIVNLRGPTDGLTFDPSKDDVDSAVLTALSGTVVDVAAPSPAVLKLIAGIKGDRAAAGALRRLHGTLSKAMPISARDLATKQVRIFGQMWQLRQLSRTNAFHDAYSSTYDDWLSRVLRGNPAHPSAGLEPALRAAHLAVSLGRVPTGELPVARLLQARVAIPTAWTSGRQARVAAHVRRAAAARAPNPSVDADIATARHEHGATLARIADLERVHSAAHRLYRSRLAAQSKTLPPVPTVTVDPARGALDRQTRYARDTSPRTFRRRAPLPSSRIRPSAQISRRR